MLGRFFEVRFGCRRRLRKKRSGFAGVFERARPALDRLFGRLEKPARRSDAERNRECLRAIGIHLARGSLFQGIVLGIAGRPAERAVRNPVLRCLGIRRCWKRWPAVPAPRLPSRRLNKVRWRREARTSRFAGVRRRRRRMGRKGAIGIAVCIGESSGEVWQRRRGILGVGALAPKCRIGFSLARIGATDGWLRPRGPIFSSR